MFLEKKDVKLYYEVRGEGTPIVLVHGAAMDADRYLGVAEILAKYYKVITYDRRGTYRSEASEDALYDVDTQVEDIKDLLDALEIASAIMIGASAGGIAVHRFLTSYPERIIQAILFEPAVITSLEHTQDSYRPWVDRIKDMVARNKLNSAIFEFVKFVGEMDERAAAKDTQTAMREMTNLYHFLPKEYETFVEYLPDLEKGKALAHKTWIAIGDRSKDAPFAKAATKFAQDIGVDVTYYPGLHNAPYDLPKEFAISVLGTLKALDL